MSVLKHICIYIYIQFLKLPYCIILCTPVSLTCQCKSSCILSNKTNQPSVALERAHSCDIASQGCAISDHPICSTVGEEDSPSECSRCSSSMGCLEPRPHDDVKNENPTDVQEKLLETVQTLTSDSRGSRLGDSPLTRISRSSAATPEPPSQSVSAPPTSSVTHSHSSQNLKSAASDSASSSTHSFRRTSLRSFFKRCVLLKAMGLMDAMATVMCDRAMLVYGGGFAFARA